MTKPHIYVAQLGTGSNINLLPLAAGQLVSRLKQEADLMEHYQLGEILFRREDPAVAVAGLTNVSVIGFSCFLWNLRHSLATARAVRERFPKALIVLGGPSIPKAPGEGEAFFHEHPFVDVVCLGEGEEVFVELCRCRARGTDFGGIPGLICRDAARGEIFRTGPEEVPDMEALPSPYVDGTFDEFYEQNRGEFSGIILETNRGCPYRCSYCTWGNQPSKRIREKPNDIVRREIEWVGRHRVTYIAMSDANFGIRERDVDFARFLAECKARYGVPNFISVSWAKNSAGKVLEIADILKKSGIGFRITLSLQSLNDDVVRAINRTNIRREDYAQIKEVYRRENLYSYTELILGLPLETHESYIAGLEASLSESIFDQLYIYPLFLFPNTEMGSRESRRRYGIRSRTVPCVYTKSKVDHPIPEYVEIVVGTDAMPEDRWVESFVLGYLTLALHDDRLAFFVLTYLRKALRLPITDVVRYVRAEARRRGLAVTGQAVDRLEACARGVQREGADHLIRPRGYGGVPFDSPEGIFLELMLDRDRFYGEFRVLVDAFLAERGITVAPELLDDLFRFQAAAMARLDDLPAAEVSLEYDWIGYFGFAFHLPERPLVRVPRRLTIVDARPSGGDPVRFLKNHFDVRGVPAFNTLHDPDGRMVFPPVPILPVTGPMSLTTRATASEGR